uniref:Putative transcription factor protein n=1 Tax=Ixodes ricinus TaxID=34613 RepID=A0A0K8RLA3_IXORI
MPISKRINSLRIRVNGNEAGQEDNDTSSSAGSSADNVAAGSSRLNRPSVLNSSENPHYHQINCLLYEAHMERQQRLVSQLQRPSEHCPGPSPT